MSVPVRHLQIEQSAFKAMEKNIWSDRYAAARMTSEGRSAPVLVRYRGGHTRDYPKRSFEVVTKGIIAHYNAEFDDPSLIRNALSFYFFAQLGVPAPRTKHVTLLLNGQPQGVYLEIEGVQRLFFRRRKIPVRALFYAINNEADFGLRSPETGKMKSSLLAGYEHRFGGGSEKLRLKAFMRGIHGTSGVRTAAIIDSKLDVDAYLRWLAGAVLTGNFDGFEQNYAIFRGGSLGKYRLAPWDYEGTWGRNCYGKTVDANMVSVSGYNQLTRKLLNRPGLRAKYKHILRRAIDGPFTEGRLMPVVRGMLNEIAPAVRDDHTRKWSYRQFLGEADVIRRYIRERRAAIAAQLKNF